MKNKGMYIGIGVAVVGIAAYFLFFRKKKSGMTTQTGGQTSGGELGGGDAPTPKYPTGALSMDRRTQKFPLATLRGVDRAILKKGVRNPMDNQVLQSYLNNLSIDKLSSGNVPEELKIDGIFGDKTEAALKFHTGKSEITVGELRQMIVRDRLKGGISFK